MLRVPEWVLKGKEKSKDFIQIVKGLFYRAKGFLYHKEYLKKSQKVSLKIYILFKTHIA